MLDATSSSVKTLHLLLFVPSSLHSPLTLLDTHGNPLFPASFLVSGFGGVSLLTSAPGLLVTAAALQPAMEMYLGLLRQLLGVDAGQVAFWVDALEERSRGITEWQMSSLQRRSAFSRIASCRRTLASLEKLITSIHNMVISDDTAVQVCLYASSVCFFHSLICSLGKAHLPTTSRRHTPQVSQAVSHLLAAEQAWSRGDFAASAVEAALADTTAEASFFHEKMLSRLYFPDDHKLAVYIPFFVPVLVPMLVALIREGKSMRDEARQARELSDDKDD